MTEDAMSSICARGVAVRYGRRTILGGVDLEVPTGSVYALLGRNGVGKSSLVRCLLGHQRPAAGKIELLGRPVWRARGELMRGVGIVPEEPHAPPDSSVAQLVGFQARLHRRWNRAGVEKRLDRFQVPLEGRFGDLSKGQKKQVELALALGHRPRLLILDDPTMGLDPVARRAFFDELIEELAAAGTTVFLTTHDLASVEGIADRVGILGRQRLLLSEPLESLKSRFRRLHLAEPDEARWRALEPLSVQPLAWGTEVVVSRFEDGVLRKAEVGSMSLEEIFTSLVGEGKGEEP